MKEGKDSQFSSASPLTVPLALGYGRREPRRHRMNRMMPRLRGRTWILLLLATILIAWFVHEQPVWKARSVGRSPIHDLDAREPIVALMPGDKRIIRTGKGEFEVLDLTTGNCIFSAADPDCPEVQLSFSKDGRRMLSYGLRNNMLRLYDMIDCKQLVAIPLPQEGYGHHECQLSDDGTRFVAWTLDGASLWDGRNGGKMAELQVTHAYDQYPIHDVRITSNQQLAVVLRPNHIDFYRLSDGTFDHGCALPSSFAFEQAMTSDGSTIVVVSLHDGKVRVLDGAGKDRVPAIAVGVVDRIQITSDDHHLLVVERTALKLIDLTTGKVSRSLPFGSPPAGHPVEFSPDGRWLFTWVTSAAYAIIDAQTLTRVATIPSQRHGQASRPFSPDGTRFISADLFVSDATSWSTASWHPISRIHDEHGAYDNWYLSDGTILRSGYNGNLTLWTRHRPEAWYGVMVLPTFWLALAASIVALVCLGVDLKRWYRPASSGS